MWGCGTFMKPCRRQRSLRPARFVFVARSRSAAPRCDCAYSMQPSIASTSLATRARRPSRSPRAPACRGARSFTTFPRRKAPRHRGGPPRARQAPRGVPAGVREPARGGRQARRRHRHPLGEALVQRRLLCVARARRRRADRRPAARGGRRDRRPVPRSGADDRARLLLVARRQAASRSISLRPSRSPRCKAWRSITSCGRRKTGGSTACSSAVRASRRWRCGLTTRRGARAPRRRRKRD